MGADGAPLTELRWLHRINGGRPLQITGNSTTTFGDRLTRVLDGGTRRITTGDVETIAISGMDRATTHLTQNFEETLMAGPPAAVILQTLHQEQQLSMEGMPPLHLLVTMMATPAMPLVDFGDRTDLDQLPVGQFADATIMISQTLTTSVDGMPDASSSTTLSSSNRSRWTILERLPSLMVLGQSYRRVVKVAVQVDSTDLATAKTTTSTNVFWLAAGIGVVRSEQALGFAVGTLPSELVETNLAP